MRYRFIPNDSIDEFVTDINCINKKIFAVSITSGELVVYRIHSIVVSYDKYVYYFCENVKTTNPKLLRRDNVERFLHEKI